MKREILVRAPATIANFGPGFDIFALALDGPYDHIRVRLRSEPGLAIRIVDGKTSLPTEPELNTAGLAAIHYFRKTGAPGGAEIEIVKNLPVGAGLGSSAAAAVAAVFGLDALLETGLGPADIVGLASLGEAASGGTPHADNSAACGLGGFAFVRSHSPLCLEKIEIPPIRVVLRVRRKSQTTTRGLIPDKLALAHVKEQMSGCAALVHAALSGDLKRIGEALNRDLISEPVRSRSIPGYGELKALVLRSGAYGCNVSGGGSSVFAVAPEESVAAVAEVMERFPRPDEARAEVIVTRSSNLGVREVDGL